MATETRRRAGRNKARHQKNKRSGTGQATYPAFSLAIDSRISTTTLKPVTAANYARYVGRIGALAIALGVGAAVSTGQGLGIARAETDAPSGDASSTDSSPSSPSSPDPSPPTTSTESTNPQSTEQESSNTGETGSVTDASGQPPSGMQVDSSGGANDSTNDAGQATDEGQPDGPATSDEGSDDAATPPPAETDSTNTAQPPATEDISAPGDETDTPPHPEDNTSSTENDAPTGGSTLHAANDDLTNTASTSSTESIEMSMQSTLDESETGAADTSGSMWANRMQANAFSAPSPTLTNPVDGLLAVPGAVVNVAQTFIAALLSPLLAPGPSAPCDPPMLWTLLGWVTREIQRTFFNRTPVVGPQEITLVLHPEEVSQPISFDGYDFDEDGLTYFVPARGVPGGPTHGSVVVDEAAGTFTYERDEGYTGPDEFTVTASDTDNCFHLHGLLSFLRPNWGHTDSAKIKLNVVAANDAPVVGNDKYITEEGSPLVGNVLSNDSDPNGDPLTATAISEPENGQLTFGPNGAFSYTPDPDFSGVDTFCYTASDSALSQKAFVAITVTPVDLPPTGTNDSFTTAEDTAVSGNVLDNDSDPNGDSLSAVLSVPASHGQVNLNSDGSFTYTPNADYDGSDAFSYVASDGTSSSAPTLVTIAVTPVNDPPAAHSDNYNIGEDSILHGNVLSNDTDADGNTLTATMISGPAHGGITFNTDGSFTYTPSANYNGSDSFTYKASDGSATSNTVTATITIAPVNDPPVAQDDSFSVNEDSALSGNVLSNDTDVDMNALTASLVSGPSHGALSLNPDGSFTYTPTANYQGVDHFSYTVYDGSASSSEALVTIAVSQVNDPPVAHADTYNVGEDGTLSDNVLSNDTDIDGNTLTASVVTGPAHGVLNLNNNGTFTYTPDADYNGADSFTYKASDGSLTGNTATVTISIAPVNDAPIAEDDSFNVNEDNTLNGNVLSNDTDIDSNSLTAVLDSGPTHGDLTFNGDGSFSYTPDPNYHGLDFFTYTASDGSASSGSGLVMITIAAVNDPPIANADTFGIGENGILNGNVLSNDTDVEGNPLTATLVTGPAHGTFNFNSDGSFTYAPDPNFSGTDSFTYTAYDGAATSTPATATVNVAFANHPPTAQNDSFTTNEDTQLAGNVLGNDSDVDADALTATLVAGPAHGALNFNADGSFTYDPDANYNGPDSFTYKANDGTTNSTTATVNITVDPVNDPPVAANNSYTISEDSGLSGNVLTNDADVDGNTLAASLVSGPTHGTLSLNADGSFTYTPDTEYNGPDAFTYKASDGALTSNTATVSITVNAANDDITGVDDSATTNEDTAVSGNVLTNDTAGNPDAGEALSVVNPGVYDTANGAITIGANGDFTYTPDADFNGTDSYTYTVSDGNGQTGTATLTITVNAVNDDIAGVNDTATTNEDTAVSGNVLTNDTAANPDAGETLSVVNPGVYDTANGAITIGANGDFTYTPDADFNGTDSYTYTVSDGNGSTGTATLTITVNAVNDDIAGVNDTATTNEDTPVSGNVLTNDTAGNPDAGETLSVVDAGTFDTANGSITIGANGDFTYTPDADFNGTDSYTYTVSDGNGQIGTATLTVTVNAVNDDITGVADSATTNEDTAVSGNVLTNDTAANPDAGETLSVVNPGVYDTANGSITISANGDYTYTPDADFNGTDSYTYTVSDGNGNTGTATLTITVNAVNDDIEGVADSASTDEDTPVSGNVLTNDTAGNPDAGETLTVVNPGVYDTANGSITIGANGDYTYTPDQDFNGTDTYTYTVSDGNGQTGTATLTVTVNAVNDAPDAAGDSFSTNEDTALTVAAPGVLGNDTDADGNPITASLVSGPAHGSLTLNADGSFTYTPDANYNGADSFTYKTSDGSVTSATATVSITVNAVNDAPVANDDAFTTNEDNALTISAPGVLGNDTDLDGNPITASLASGPAHGSLTLNANGTFTYTPDTDFNGTDSFTYTVSDGTTNGNAATVSITVTAVNDDIEGVADSASTDEDTPISGNVLNNDTAGNPDAGETLSVVNPGVYDTANGAITIGADGDFTYTPDADFNGTDSYTYTVSDGNGQTGTATLTITVNATNDDIEGVADTATTNEDTAVSGNVLSNDTAGNPDAGETLSVVDLGTFDTANGSITISGNGDYTYTPDDNFNGTDSYTYTVSDGNGNTGTATLTVTVNAVNDDIQGVNDSATTNEDTPVSGNVLTNDTAANPDAGEALSVANPGVYDTANGSITIDANGDFTYTPDTDFSGTDTYTYTVSDGNGQTGTATLTITVNAVNDAPVAAGDSFSTNEDSALTVAAPGVLGNDTDAEGNPLTASLVSGPSNGTLTLNADGSFTYTPDANFNGNDSFTYIANDGTTNGNITTVSIAVNAVNDAPVANNDAFTINEDNALTISAPGVLGNDTDLDGNSLTASLVSGPSNGTLTLNADGSFTYTPDTDFNGTDSFTYTVSDGTTNGNTATVAITVNAVNDDIAGVNDTATTNEDTALSGNVLTNDVAGNPDAGETLSVVNPGTFDTDNGSITIDANGDFTYTPDTDFNGTDFYTYTVSDGNGQTGTATLTVTVNAVNDDIAGVDDTVTTNEDTPISGNVLTNDTAGNPDAGETLSVVNPGTYDTAHGSIAIGANGDFTYTPDTDFNGTDTYTYTVSDGNGQTGTATLTITVNAVNDAPAATNDSFSTNEDNTLAVSAPGVLGNDTDLDGDPITASLVSGPTHGTLTLNADGSFTYTPDANYNGADFFTYKVSDGSASSNTATVTITVNALNDAPVANNDSYTTNEDDGLTVSAPGVLSNDTDLDGNPITASLVSGPTHGTLTLNADGSFTYTPDADYNGTDSFTYAANDGSTDGNTATVSITVSAVNDDIIGVADSATTNEDTPISGNVLSNDTVGNPDAGETLSVVDPGTFDTANGSITINANGDYTYTPDTDFNGTDTYTYTVSDGNGQTGTATLTVTVTAVNEDIQGVNDFATTNEDTPVSGNVLTNDTAGNPDAGETLSVVNPGTYDTANGSITVDANGDYTYTPDTDFNGTDTYTYTVSDGNGQTGTATLTITVNATNDDIQGVNDSATTNEDTPVSGNVLTNDTAGNPDAGEMLSVVDAGTHTTANGSITINANGDYTYTPDTDFNGTDSYTYTVSDGNGNTGTATLTITVNAVNDAPVAAGDSVTTDEDTPVSGNVLGNDTDVDGNPLTAILVSGPAHGSLTFTADGSFTYSPAADYHGSDSFTYKANDGTTDSNIATVSITVNSVNDAPVANNDAYTINEDSGLTGNVLSNDTDVDGNALTAILVADPAHGSLTLNPDGSFSYTPAANYNGTDSFTYTASDGTTNGNTASVTIVVTAINDAPVANDDSFSTSEDTPLDGNVLSNDFDVEGNSLTASVVDGPDHGTLTFNSNGTFTYNPDANYHGPDSFTYVASDGTAPSGTALVTLTVTPVNDAPVANDDAYTIDEDSGLAGNVLTTDSDVDGDILTAAVVSGPTHGTLNLNPNGTFTYNPDANYHGTDSFTYTADDGTAPSNVATVSITIDPVNDAPVANNDAYTTDEDSTLTVSVPGVLDNDTDVDGDSLTAAVVSGPGHGILNVNADGSFTYTPTANYNGTDSFTYKTDDGNANSNTATVTITVNAVNDAPVANNDARTINEDSGLTGNVLTNDTDVDGNTMTATLVSGPSHGTLTLNPDGSFSYHPAANYNGTDSFTYTASDGSATSNTALVTIAITAVNDGPVANDDSFTTNEDTTVNGNVLSNDTDVEGNALTASLVSGPSHGSLTLNTDGTYTYTPTGNYNGTDSFTYTASDGSATSNTAIVTISITPVNDAPVASNDSHTINEDSTLTGNVLTNDTDVDGNTLTAAVVSGPSHGSLTLNNDGTFTYTPTANYNGTDSFTYKANDGITNSNTATVSITINAANDAPVANNDAYTTNEDTTLNGNVLSNDTDAEGNTLTAAVVSGPAHGSLTLNGNGTFTYTPTANYNGTDSFTYTANDGTATGNTATVSITVNPVNDTPVATNDSYSTNEDTALTISAPGVLGNDTDVDGNPLTASVITGPAHGVLSLNSDGSFTYTPAANYNGTDVFTYKANDGTVNGNTAIVAITVNAVNDAPVATHDAFTTNEDTALNGNVLSNDTDADANPLTASLVTGPSHGVLSLNSNGTFTYTPTANYNGTDSFTYRVNDGATNSNNATVTITVSAVNDAPVANNDTVSTNEDTALTVSAPGVLTNDTDADADALTAAVVSGPAHGTLGLNADGSFTYTPAANYNGTDSFTYRTNDGSTNSNNATVTITVNAVNDAPVANNDTVSTNEDTAVNGNVLSNDTDVDGNPLTAALVTGPAHGTLGLNADGTYTYTPDLNFNGSDSFTYTASDGSATSNTAAVSITINPVNDAPVANNDTVSTNEDTAITNGNVLTNDTDADGNPLTATLVGGVAHGALVLNGNGTYTYTPALNYNGTDSFTYKLNDGTVDSNTATVTITINPVNDAPVANNANVTAFQDTAFNGTVVATDVDGNTLAGGTLSATQVTGPGHGTLSLNSNGTYTYTPTSGYKGADSFTYKVSDGTLDSNIATVSITVADNVKPAAVDVQTSNGGGTNGLMQQGDTITYTFSEPINPNSIKTGWDGSSTSVVVRAYDGDILLNLLGGNDSLQVFDTSNNLLPLGAVNMGRGDYVTGLLGGSITFGASGTPSTMTMSGNTITITLGTYDGQGILGANRSTASSGGTHAMIWTPVSGPTDLAGNPIATPITSPTELGADDRDF